MKKLLSVLLTAGLILCGSFAAGADEAKPFEGVELTFTQTIEFGIEESEHAEFWNGLLSEFEELTGAHTTLLLIDAGQVTAQSLANLAAGGGPDVQFVTFDNRTTFIKNGYLEPLDGFFSEEETSRWSTWDTFKADDGKHYVVAAFGGNGGRCMFMNMDLCRELGLPELGNTELTWDKMIEYCSASVEAGHKGYVAAFTGDANATMDNCTPFLFQAGGQIVNDEGTEWTLDTPESIRAFKMVSDLFTSGACDAVDYTQDVALADFLEGDTLMYAGDAGTITTLPEDEVPFDAHIYNLRDVRSARNTAYGCYAINAASENKEAAAALISFLVSEESMNKLAEFKGGGDAIFTDADYSTLVPEKYVNLFEDTDYIWTYPAVEGISDAVEYMIVHQQLVAMGDETPEQAAAELQASCEALWE